MPAAQGGTSRRRTPWALSNIEPVGTKDTTPPRRRMSREARGAQLLDVAEELFVDKGFEGTSMEDIARRAGVTRPMVYSHFPTKEVAFVACVERARGELETRMRDCEIMIAAGAGIRAVIECGGQIFFSIVERNPRRWMVLFNANSALSPELESRMLEMRTRTITRIARMTRHFAADIDEERNLAFAYAISGVGEQMGRWWLADPDLTRDRVVEHYCDFITGGLSAWLGQAAPSADT